MKHNDMSLMSPRNHHHLTFGVGCVLVCVVMLLYLLHKTHDQLDVTRADLGKMNEKFISLTRQFESLYEYKERLESSFVDLKEKKSAMTSHSDSLKSELSVLKQSHRTEMQRLQDELDSCRRHEEMAVIRNQPQRDEALPPQPGADSLHHPPHEGSNGHPDKRGRGGVDQDIKVISSLSKASSTHRQPHQGAGAGIGNVINFIRDKGVQTVTNQPVQVQPSMDPNQDPVGNVFI